MVKLKAKSSKEEPPDRGRPKQLQNAASFPKSPLRSAKTSRTNASSPKPLKKERYDKYTVESFLKSPIVTTIDKTVKGPIPKLLKAAKELGPKDLSMDFTKSSRYTVNNGKNITATHKGRKSSSSLRNKKNSMECDETPISNISPQSKAGTKVGKDRKGANSIEGFVNITNVGDGLMDLIPQNNQGKVTSR